jgi:hypothetical protein
MRGYGVAKWCVFSGFAALSFHAAAAPKPAVSPAEPSAPATSPAPSGAPATSGPPEETRGPAPSGPAEARPGADQQGPEPTSIPTPVRREDEQRRPQAARLRGRGPQMIDLDSDDDVESDEPSETRHARDTLSSHVVIAANGGFFFPAGSFDQTTYQSDKLGPGFAVGGDIGYGISHTAVLGVFGELGLPKSEICSTCSGSSFSVGPLIRYHLVQGVRFDPWLSAGAGFRKTTLGSEAWTGIDVVRIQLGGDFYPWPALGFGPVAELAIGTYFDATPKLATHSVYANFVLGVRVVFDSPGK